MNTYFDLLPSELLTIIGSYLIDISDIFSMINLDSRREQYLLKDITQLKSDKIVHTPFYTYSACKKLVDISDNILFDIENPTDVKMLPLINTINFYFRSDEFESIHFFLELLNQLPADISK